MVRIRLLGEFVLDVGGAETALPGRQPARALLGWLALHPGMHARSEIAARLWPDVLDASARASLRTALSSVRRALGPAAADHSLVATRQHVGLAGEPDVWVDALAFEARAAAGRHEEALALCRGELLAGLDDEWVLVARGEHRQRHGEVLAALADTATAAGDPETALAHAHRRVALDPLDEPAHRDLIRLLAAAGNRAGALAAYERLAGRLRRELAVAPSPQTRVLAEALRHGDAESTPPYVGGPAPSPPAGPSVIPARIAPRDGRTPFVGRGAVLGRLRVQWELARHGQRRLAFLAGEPGIGKTRVAAELARALHQSGAIVLYGRAEEDALVPYQPFAEALQQTVAAGIAPTAIDATELAALVPDLARRATSTAQSPHGSRPRLFEAIGALLDSAAAQRPLLLVLDDLHWADRATLRLLVHYLTRPDEAAVLVLGAYRATELTSGHPLENALADLRRELPLEHMALDGLCRDEVAAMLESFLEATPTTGSVDRLRERTRGNPFFIEELLRHLQETGSGDLPAGELAIPEGIRQVVAPRVARLGPATGALLSACAVIGPEFDLDVAAQVADVALDPAVDALDAALRAGLLVEIHGSPTRHAFAHALVRDTLVDALSATRTARLHELIAAALQPRARADPDRYLGALAHHALEGAAVGNAAQAVALAERAAARQTAAHAYEETAQLLDRALTVLRGAGGPAARQAKLLCSLGEALERAGARDRARAAFDEATELAHTAGDHALLARAALGYGGVGVTILDVDHALIRRLEDALRTIDDTDGALRVRLLARLAIELRYSSDAQRSEAISRQALDDARRLGDDGALAAALSAEHVVLSAPEHTAERLRCATEMLDLARRAGDRELALQARNWRIADFFELGEGDATNAELDAYAALAAQSPLPVYSWYVPMWRATIAVLAGRLHEGAELARRARDLGRRAGDGNADVFWREHRHMRWLADERYEEWTEQEIAYVDQKAQRSPAGRAFSAGLAMVYAALDRHDDARLALDIVALDDFAAVPRDMNWLSTMACAAEACALLGDRGRAQALRTLLEPHADRLVVAGRASFHFGSVAYFLARLATTLGDHQAADALYADAARRDERAGAAVWVVRDLRHHGELLLERGESRQADELLDRAANGARLAGLERVRKGITATRDRLRAQGGAASGPPP